MYHNTKEVLKAVKLVNEECLAHNFPSQGVLLSFYLDYSLRKFNGIWSGVQSNLPVNSFNFIIKYLNNTLPTHKNLCLWKLRQSSDCQVCLLLKTLLHVVAGCKVYLEQGWYTWWHNSILNFLATALKVVEGSSLFVHTQGFPSRSIITGDDLRPDLLLKTKDNSLYIVELGFEPNLNNSAERNICVVYSTRVMLPSAKKDSIPTTQKSCVVYELACQCEARYIGRTTQRLADRIKQHVPMNIRKKSNTVREQPTHLCKNNNSRINCESAIGQHLLTNPECAKTYTDDNFRIIGQARLSFHLSVLESVYIKTQNPVLCKQKDFIFSLGIFK